MRLYSHAFVPAVAAVLLLAACGSGERDSAPAADVQVAQDASEPAPADPPVAATPSAPAPPAAQVLTAQGWGPLRIGMSLAEIEAALGPDAEPDAVGGAEPERCDQFRPERAPKGMLVMVEEGRLTRISLIREAAIRTDRGLGLGDSAAAVRAAYGTAAATTPHKYQDAPAAYITAWAKGGAAGAATDPNARGIRYEIGDGGKVAMIHAGGPAIEYVEGCS